MKALRTFGASFCLLLLGCPRVFSQSASAEQALAASVAAAHQPYAQAFAVHPQLLNGPEYRDYSKRYHARTGHQFFLVPELQAGSIYYNNHLFSDVKLAYDLVYDQVVISPANSPLTLRLVNEKARGFTIGPHRFVRLVADSASSKVMRTGYYEVLLDSTVQVLAKRTKRLQERINQQQIDVEFTQVDKLLLQKAGRYYPVSSKATVLRVLADRGPEMRQYLQTHKLKFGRSQREASVVQLVAYYDGLPPR